MISLSKHRAIKWCVRAKQASIIMDWTEQMAHSALTDVKGLQPEGTGSLPSNLNAAIAKVTQLTSLLLLYKMHCQALPRGVVYV